MKYPLRRRHVSHQPLATFPPEPLMLEIQAAGRHGDELLAQAIRAINQRNRISNGVGIGVLEVSVGAATFWYWLHPEWPADSLATLFSSILSR